MDIPTITGPITDLITIAGIAPGTTIAGITVDGTAPIITAHITGMITITDTTGGITTAGITLHHLTGTILIITAAFRPDLRMAIVVGSREIILPVKEKPIMIRGIAQEDPHHPPTL